MFKQLTLGWRKVLPVLCIALAMSAVAAQGHALANQLDHGLAPLHTHDGDGHHDDHHDGVVEAGELDEAGLRETAPGQAPSGLLPASHHHHTDTVAGLAASSPDVDYPASAALTRLAIAVSGKPLGWIPSGPDEPPRPLTISA